MHNTLSYCWINNYFDFHIALDQHNPFWSVMMTTGKAVLQKEPNLTDNLQHIYHHNVHSMMRKSGQNTETLTHTHTHTHTHTSTHTHTHTHARALLQWQLIFLVQTIQFHNWLAKRGVWMRQKQKWNVNKSSACPRNQLTWLWYVTT